MPALNGPDRFTYLLFSSASLMRVTEKFEDLRGLHLVEDTAYETAARIYDSFRCLSSVVVSHTLTIYPQRAASDYYARTYKLYDPSVQYDVSDYVDCVLDDSIELSDYPGLYLRILTPVQLLSIAAIMDSVLTRGLFHHELNELSRARDLIAICGHRGDYAVVWHEVWVP